jgi:hypothetical protein
VLLHQLFPFLTNEPIQFIEEFSISFADGVNYASKYGFHTVGAATEQSFNDVLSNPLGEISFGYGR